MSTNAGFNYDIVFYDMDGRDGSINSIKFPNQSVSSDLRTYEDLSNFLINLYNTQIRQRINFQLRANIPISSYLNGTGDSPNCIGINNLNRPVDWNLISFVKNNKTYIIARASIHNQGATHYDNISEFLNTIL